MTDHYETLGVARDASADDIKRAFRAKRKAHHPDRQGGSHESMAAINAANDVLSDPDRRAHYDATGKDDRKLSVQELAESMLVSVFGSLLDTTSDILDEARRNVTSMREAGIANIGQATRDLDRLKARRARVRVKSGVNIVHQLIDGRVSELQQSIVKVQSAVNVANVALAILDEYESDEELDPAERIMNGMLREALSGAGRPSINTFGARFRPFGF